MALRDRLHEREMTHHPQKAGYRVHYAHPAFAQVRGPFDAAGRSLRDRNFAILRPLPS